MLTGALRSSPRQAIIQVFGGSASTPASLRALGSSLPSSYARKGWRKDGNHVPPYSTWLAEKELAARLKRARPPAHTSGVRFPPLPPTVDPLRTTAYSYCKELTVTTHLPPTPTASLPAERLHDVLLGPLERILRGVHGTMRAGLPIDVRAPLSVLWTFERAGPVRQDATDSWRTAFALVHAHDLAQHLREGAQVAEVREDVVRAAALSQGDRVVLFVLDANAPSTCPGPSDDWTAVGLKAALRRAELESNRTFSVAYLGTAGPLTVPLHLLAYMAAVASAPYEQEDGPALIPSILAARSSTRREKEDASRTMRA